MHRVGIWTAAALIVANTVGSGIFTTTGFMARDIGSAPLILILWALGGVLALAGALTYAQLGLRWPKSGGEYIYITRTYGPLAGFLSGWTSFALGFGAAIAASAVAFSHYFVILADQLLGQASAVGYIMDDDSTGSPGDSIRRHSAFIALCLVWTLTLFHSRSIAMSKSVQLLLTAVKLAFVLGFFTAAFGYGITDRSGNWDHFQSGDPGNFSISATCVALVFVMYSYSGWNAASYIAEEMQWLILKFE